MVDDPSAHPNLSSASWHTLVLEAEGETRMAEEVVDLMAAEEHILQAVEEVMSPLEEAGVTLSHSFDP